MRVRAYTEADADSVAAIHAAQGLDYAMPDLSGRMVPAKSVCEKDGAVVGAIALKLQAETYLWLSKGLTPQEKWDAIRLLQRDIVRQAMRLGIEQLVAYVPDCVGKYFCKRLKLLNWVRPRGGFQSWVYEVKP